MSDRSNPKVLLVLVVDHGTFHGRVESAYFDTAKKARVGQELKTIPSADDMKVLVELDSCAVRDESQRIRQRPALAFLELASRFDEQGVSVGKAAVAWQQVR